MVAIIQPRRKRAIRGALPPRNLRMARISLATKDRRAETIKKPLSNRNT